MDLQRIQIQDPNEWNALLSHELDGQLSILVIEINAPTTFLAFLSGYTCHGSPRSFPSVVIREGERGNLPVSACSAYP